MGLLVVASEAVVVLTVLLAVGMAMVAAATELMAADGSVRVGCTRCRT